MCSSELFFGSPDSYLTPLLMSPIEETTKNHTNNVQKKKKKALELCIIVLFFEVNHTESIALTAQTKTVFTSPLMSRFDSYFMTQMEAKLQEKIL